jgi:hypothetical protein
MKIITKLALHTIVYPPYSIKFVLHVYIPYLCEKGPMAGAPYIGPRLGGGLIFVVSLAHFDAKEHPGKLPTRSSLF